ncbi:MAG TPA: GTP cyclohydrolase II RibA [Burkholderiaceae bacterium]|nr:GTP cyclohydrolase II RibA [Burkholderiaceae bacterium]
MTPSLHIREAGRDVAAAQSAIRLDRMQTEFRRGRPVVMQTTDPAATLSVLAAVETLSAARLRELLQCAGSPRLLLTAERLQFVGWPRASEPGSLLLASPITIERVQRLAAVLPGAVTTAERADLVGAQPCTPSLEGALRLAKRSRLVPALLVVELPATALPGLLQDEMLRVFDTDLIAPARPHAGAAPNLIRVGDAHVPIAACEDCTLVLFREPHGDAEHLAIVVGQPDLSRPVPVRVHSACFTGDLLGSLRCDCGDQLRIGVERLAETGGVVLYLGQEGRGTGLANKLRAYRLQDAGLDTIEADRCLGFSADERDFGPAVSMLKQLGISRIQLLTNNPHKIDSMRRGGLDVVDRVALLAPVNPHNARYVQTKHQRAGHYAQAPLAGGDDAAVVTTDG